MNLTFFHWILAFIPIATVMILMLGFKWSGKNAGLLALILTIIISIQFFGANIHLIFFSTMKSILNSFDILWIIWPAMLLYQIAHSAGALTKITQGIVSLTKEKVLQTLLIGWLLVSFLQGMAGYGVPVAICAPLLVSLGYSPLMAVVMASVGSAWSVNYGSLGSGFQTLLSVTGVASSELTPFVGIMLGVLAILCGFLVAYLINGRQALKQFWVYLLVTGFTVAIAQYVISVFGPWNMAVILSTIAGLAVSFLLFRINHKNSSVGSVGFIKRQALPDNFITYAFAYEVLIALSLIISLIPSSTPFFKLTNLHFAFPATSTNLGWITAVEPNRSFRVFNHPGMLLLISCIVSFWFYTRKGFIKSSSARMLFSKVVKSASNSSLAILIMMAMATLMTHSGMTYLLSVGIKEGISSTIFPFVSPFIGALGAILTGSNNNSNVLFGMMQKDTAILMGLNTGIILAAQTIGGSLGSMISPAKIIVGCSSVGVTKQEGEAMKKVLIIILIPIILTGLMAFAMQNFLIK